MNASKRKFLTDFSKEVYSCVHCGYCLDLCPTRDAGHFDIYGSRGKMIVFKALLEGFLEVDKDFADKVLNCALCGWCTHKCPEEIPTTDVFVAARYEIVRRGFAPEPVKKCTEWVLNKNNPFGAPLLEKVKWSKGLNLKEKGETLLFASCMNTLVGYVGLINRIGISFNSLVNIFNKLEKLRLDGIVRGITSRLFNPNGRYYKILRDAVKVLRVIGIEPAFLGSGEPCCGKPLHTYGYIEEFEKHAEAVSQLMKERGVKRVIVLNPICTYTFRILYPKVLDSFDLEVKNISEILAENLDKWIAHTSLNRPTKLVYHDPCYMSRYMDIIEPPRIILKSIDGIELVEPTLARKDTYCTGDGGLEVTHPEAAKKIALKRVQMLLETGAEKIVTTCPACIEMLKLGLRFMRFDRKVEVLDLVEIVASSIKD